MRPFSEETFLNVYVNECRESEPVYMATNIEHTIINANYKKVDLNNIIHDYCQHLGVP